MDSRAALLKEGSILKMKKAELEKYAIPALPKSRRDAVYHAESIRYIVRSGYSPDRKTLVVAFYDREAAANGFSLPVGVLYLRKDEYLTKIVVNSEMKWRECRIQWALRIGAYTLIVCLTQTDRKRILSFLKKSSDSSKYYEEKKDKPIHELLEQFQTDILERRLKKKKERRAAKIDLRMTEVPQCLPKSFSRWVDEKPLLRSRYLFYRRVKKNLAACVCTYCQQDFFLKRGETEKFPAHNKEGRCPHCGSVVTFKAIGRTKHLTDHEKAAIFQRTKKGEIVLRFFHFRRYFDELFSSPRTECQEEARLFLSPTGEITGEYKYGYSVKTGRYGWYAVKDQLVGEKKEIDFVVRLGLYQSYENLWFQERYVFTANLHGILKQLNLSFDLKHIFRTGKVDLTSCLFRSYRYPFAPSLYRIGLERVGMDLLVRYFDPAPRVTSGPLHKQLGISKKELGWVRESGWGMREIEFMGKLQDSMVQKEEVRWFVENKIAVEAIRPFRQLMTYHRMIRYTKEQQKKQSSREADSSPSETMRQWQDYLEMCKKLDYDRRQDRVLFPRNLREEHDKLVQLIQVRKNAEADQKIQEVYPALEKQYSYQEKEYLIRPPRNFEDFVKEGASLAHCVCASGYYRGHVAGDRLIFFVQNTADVESPLCTMEYDAQRRKVLQLRGYRNQAAPPEVREFVDRWLKKKCRKQSRKLAA